MTRALIFVAVMTVGVLIVPAAVSAAGNPSGTGQPNQSCQSVTGSGGTTPGGSASSPGAPFNEPTATSSGGTGGTAYNAGNARSPNPTAVSQYDVACYQVSSH